MASRCRTLAQTCHPDKHTDPEMQALASQQFARLQQAYEVSSPGALRATAVGGAVQQNAAGRPPWHAGPVESMSTLTLDRHVIWRIVPHAGRRC